MFKNKISAKLSMYFAIALIIFAIIIGSIFVLLFRNQSLDAYKTELEKHSTQIADTLSGSLDEKGNGMSGFSMYLRLIGDVAGADVWIVDKDLNLITGGRGQGNTQHDYRYADLPINAGELITKAFTGESVFSEDFSNLLSEHTLSIGTPIFNRSNEVIGVVLLHSPIQGINQAISQGIIILIISILLALLVSFLLSILFSRSFTKPLFIMKNTALRLINGEYSAKTNIKQDDEIGELASTLDILATRLDSASQQSERLEEMRQEFVANISHELKTPITVIRGSLEALVDEVVSDPLMVQEYHKQMLKESKFLQRLVGDLLDLSKLQSMEFTIEKKEISMVDIVDDVARSAEYLAQQASVSIEVQKETSSCKMMGDYGRIRQMIMIVLDNAIKFSPQNEVVSIILEENKLSIHDKGIGISAEQQPYIFERFYKSRSEQNKIGTGLGLAIAKKIADRHDIELTVESIEGKGSTFIFNWNI
jgi:signal transduction histidine kinase